MKQLYLCIPIVVIAMTTSGFEATAQTTSTLPPQYFTLSLPAGVSLVSAPLNTGQTVAQGEFQGLPADYPLFFAWNPYTQSWVPGNQAPASMGGGYWVYLPVPANLVVQGQPYSYSTSFSGTVNPGWHLFGVPFEEGVGWKDFHLYAGGNPISLDTAMAMGWISQNVVTMQGSEVQTLPSGQPLQPGVAYWVQTFVPFQLQAERRQPATTSTILPTMAPLDSGTVTDDPAASCALQSTSSSSYDSSSAMGWLSATAEFLSEVTLGIAKLPESGWGGASEIASGTFGMIEHSINLGFGTGEDAQLSDMDAQLGTLVTNVCQMQIQLNNIGNQVSGLQNWIVSDTLLSSHVRAADSWLWPNFQDPNSTNTSREWARWILAGCSTSGSSCPEGDGTNGTKAVTTDSLNNFKSTLMQSPGTLALATDDFPLWWSYSVVGGANGVNPFLPTGKTLQRDIFTALTATPMTKTTNGLVAYMEQVFGESGCVNDVTACNLLQSVYYPVEAYFLKAVGDQASLAEAQSEAWLTLSALGKGSTGPADVLKETNNELNRECEAFLEVAERIALLRAADGTVDWNNFGSSDAGQLLARADFIVMQLAGQNYNSGAGYVNPPWPSSGVVGRVFYVDGQTPLSSSGQRGICQETSTAGAFNPGAANCSTPVAYLTENTATARTVTGDWPYLLWSSSNGTATGSPHLNWTVQRLNPLPLANLPTTTTAAYVVNSQAPERLGANLFVGSYDSIYNNLPAPATGSITFASVNGIEGAIGKYGLPLDGTAWTVKGGTSVREITLNVTATDVADAPGLEDLTATYPAIAAGTDNTPSASVSWSASANIQFQSGPLPLGWTTASYHLHWPTTVKVNLAGGITQRYTGPGQGDDYYYSSLALSQQFTGNSASASYSCPSAPSIPARNRVRSPSTCRCRGSRCRQRTLSAPRSVYGSALLDGALWPSSTARSSFPTNNTATWLISAPSFTLTK